MKAFFERECLQRKDGIEPGSPSMQTNKKLGAALEGDRGLSASRVDSSRTLNDQAPHMACVIKHGS
jgi:hypothetical protein